MPTSTPAPRSAEDALRAAYDRVPYPAYAQHQTHPELLAALGVLHGLEPAPPAKCRVLELGCADGGNLLPMACQLPASHFVGVDLSPRQIDDGRKVVEELGLDNLELIAGSLLDIGPSHGSFDYIIAHGVYSWIPPEVQDQLLAICRQRLTPHGIAYVSYNTFPGWHQRRAVRDMMLYRTRDGGDAGERTEQAVTWIDQLATAVGTGEDAWPAFLRSSRDHLEEYRDRPGYIFHEYLEADNTPLYFHQFVERAERHDLRFLAEADYERSELGNLQPAVAELIEGAARDRLELEQYIDFATNRAFRRTLLCAAEHPVDPALVPARIRRLFAATPVETVAAEPGAPAASRTFRTPQGRTFSTSHGLAKAVFVLLGQRWPEALSFEDLRQAISQRLSPQEAGAEVLADFLHSMFYGGVLELWTSPPRSIREVTARPKASALARWQAAAGRLLTNQRHQVVKLDDPLARLLVAQLDGRRDRADLAALVEREVHAGRLELEADDQEIQPGARLELAIAQLIEHHLAKMPRYALLVE